MTIGVIAGAIGTSSLLKTNQRAMASATVGFVGFGLVLLCLIAVPAIAQLVRTVAGGWSKQCYSAANYIIFSPTAENILLPSWNGQSTSPPCRPYASRWELLVRLEADSDIMLWLALNCDKPVLKMLNTWNWLRVFHRWWASFSVKPIAGQHKINNYTEKERDKRGLPRHFPWGREHSTNRRSSRIRIP